MIEKKKLTDEEQVIYDTRGVPEFSETDVKEIYKGTKGLLEKIKGITYAEQDMYKMVSRGECFFYNVYVIRLKDIRIVNDLTYKLENLMCEIPVLRTIRVEYHTVVFDAVLKPFKKKIAMKDLSMMSPKKRMEKLTKTVLAARYKLYEAGKSLLYNIEAVKFDEEDYYCILSLANVDELLQYKKKLFQELLGNSRIKNPYFSRESVEENKARSILHWRQTFASYEAQLPRKRYQNKDGVQRELMMLSDNLSKLLKDCSSETKVLVENLIITSMGIVLSKHFKEENILAGGENISGLLRAIPILLNTRDGINRMLKSVQKQLIDGRKFDGAEWEEIRKNCGLNEKSGILFVQNYIDEERIMLRMLNMEYGLIYEISARNHSGRPLTVITRKSEEHIFITYEYREKYFSAEDIEMIHGTFTKIIEGIARAIYSGKEYNQSTEELVPKQDVTFRTRRIAAILEKCKVFNFLDSQVLYKLSQECVYKSVPAEEVLIDFQDKVDKFYVIAEGKVNVGLTNAKQVLMPVQMLSEGMYFGVESLSFDSESNKKYTAFTNIVSYVEIPADVMRKLIQEHPAICYFLLKKQVEETEKFQRLWIIE